MRAVLALMLLAATAAASPAGTAGSARTFDRTLLCSTAFIGGVHEIALRTHAGVRDGASWHQLAFAQVTTGTTGSRPTVLDNSLAWVSAGRPTHSTHLTNVDFAGILLPAQTHGTLAVNRKLCRATSAHVLLTAKGLRGGPADAFADEVDCATPRRVLVRVRATFLSGAPLYQDQRFLRTRGALTAAYLAVRTQAGKPLAYATVSGNGTARLFTTAACTPD